MDNHTSPLAALTDPTLLKTDALYTQCRSGAPLPAAVCQTGVMDRVLHPVEPLAVRLTVAGQF